MKPAIAVVGMACRYADAPSPEALWQNVLAQRRAFRRLPPERLRLEDYYSPDHATPDATYATEAAVLEGWDFDRLRFRVVGSTFRSADLAHWLALEVAADALADAGFADGRDLPRAATGVLLGNSLTGEFSRAALLRYRWPYVRRMLAPALAREGLSAERAAALLARLEEDFKHPFEPVGEESLAGGLANTIAGRICNHFDLGGGGYTLDGACASSLLAIAQAASALALGDLDVAIAGGVDLSLDPFELVGFAKAGALAEGEMRVFDTRSDGFIPGEGCGVVVLMRLDDAIASGRRVHAVVRGWGISSDGSGGITRPELEGQLLALRRAYRRAGFGAETVAYFEGHGTGTKVGDDTELRTLSTLRREALANGAAGVAVAAVGSVKANVGHTKAAAGAAGLIKATLVLEHGLLPPTTGCTEPHPELAGEQGEPVLRVLATAEPWPHEGARRAGVSAMGFGGINVHLVLEAAMAEHRRALTAPERRLVASPQDAELFLFAGRDAGELERRLEQVAGVALGLSRAELGDLAGELARALAGGRVRAAVVAASPAQLGAAIARLRAWLAEGRTHTIDVRQGLFLSDAATPPRLGFLFPGQGAPAHLDGGVWRRRFRAVEELYEASHGVAGDEVTDDGVATEVAQPAIVRAALAGLALLTTLGLEAQVAVGHSLGELVALHWAGAMTAPALERLAARRGRAMAELAHPGGAMAQIEAAPAVVEALLADRPEVVIACFNGREQTVVSGLRAAVVAVAAAARAQGLRARELAVSHAFHSPLVAAAAAPLRAALEAEDLAPLARRVVSTVTGTALDPGHDLRALLTAQLTSPVCFVAALAAASRVDLWLEIGPGRSAAGLAETLVDAPVVALDVGSRSLEGLLRAVGAAHALGAAVDVRALFEDRFLRPFELERPRRFLANPCEQAPVDAGAPEAAPAAVPVPAEPALALGTEQGALEVLRALVARRTELPRAAIDPAHRLLSDLHLSSIAVGQLVAEASKQLGIAASAAATEYADASVREISQALDELRRTGAAASLPERAPAGVDAWVRAFTLAWVERPLPRARVSGPAGSWRILGACEHLLRAVLEHELGMLPGGDGVALLLSETADPEVAIRHLLAAARAVLDQRPARCLFIHHPARGFGASGFAKTLHLETGVPTLVVDLPPDTHAVERIMAELLALGDFAEVAYGAEGERREPLLRSVPLEEGVGAPPCAPGDVVLVTGGGKGIAAECARALATRFGVRLAILGRAQPAADAELAANLDRLAALGVAFRYVAADVADAVAVARAVAELEAELGPIVGLLHSAGINHPRLLAGLDEADFRATVRPKTDGLANLLAALDPHRLRLLVGFGSVIAHTGLRGEADYAAANEWLGQVIERFAAAHPGCRCLDLAWSVWSGVGMGERLGRIDALVQGGITPIPPETGVAMLERLLLAPPAVSVVVSGRFGDVPTLRLERPELPLRRFLESPRVYFSGIELVAQARLTVTTDPYLDEHVYQGERLLPAVVGLEAMAQVAMALAETHELPVFEDARFDRPVVVPAGEGVEVRVAALVRAPGRVDVVLRSAATAFQVDHFSVRCLFDRAAETPAVPELPRAGERRLPLDVDRDVYAPLLFHEGRFRRVVGYHRLLARETVAELGRGGAASWFGGFLPRELVLGDAGLRDAAIHALQASVPHRTLLPIAIERLEPGVLEPGGSYTLHARERRREGDVFVYDLETRDAGGRAVDRWRGLRLRALAPRALPALWPAPLVGPHVARRLEELVAGAAVEVVLERADLTARPGRTDRVLAGLVGKTGVVRRADGKPEVPGGPAVSAAHSGELVLAAAAAGAVGCDLEAVLERPSELWRDLLGPERLELAAIVASETGEDTARAATRVWTAGECLKKAGLAPAAPLVFVARTSDGWVLLAAGETVVATWLAQVEAAALPLVLAVLVSRHAAAGAPAGLEVAARHARV